MNHFSTTWQAAADELAGKTILVTGAGDGIGRAAALSYAQHGATVLLLGRTEEKLTAVYDAIVSAGGATPAIIPVDLATTTHDALSHLAAELEGSFAHLDGVLHNASILGDRKPLAQTRAAGWLEVMQVNVNSAFMLTQTLMPMIERAPSSSIVFTSSGVGRQGRAYWGAYAVSKFATEGLMQVWSDELAATTAVRVNTLNPGAVNTAMRRMAYPAENPTNNPSPDTLMRIWVWLMSDASRGVTGQALDAQ